MTSIGQELVFALGIEFMIREREEIFKIYLYIFTYILKMHIIYKYIYLIYVYNIYAYTANGMNKDIAYS